MDFGTLAALAALVLSLVGMVAVALRLQGGKSGEAEAGGGATEDIANVGGGGRRAGGTSRMRRRQAADANANAGADDADDADADDAGGKKKIGVKKARKLAEKEERRLMREEQERIREEQKAAQAEKERQRKLELKKEAEERKKQEAIEAEEKRKQEEEERKAYEAIKASFTVEDHGSVEEQLAEESQGLLQEFVDYIKTTKVVALEDLATHFKIPTKSAVDRVKDLEADGRISGVIDDRGKFIFVSPDEMEEVAKYIKLQGRVSISDLTSKASDLIKFPESA